MTRLSVWAPLPPGALARRAHPPPFPLGRSGVRLFSRARHGLAAAAAEIEGREVLVPAWHHGSEIEAFARSGVRCRFYDVGPDPRPDGEALDALRGPATAALHLTHFLGFPQDTAAWRGWADERGLLLIEDGAQAWLAEDGGLPVGSRGDIAVFSLYKSVGVPDGGALVARRPPPPPPGAAPMGMGATLRRQGAWLLARSRALARLRGGRGSPPYDPAEDRALGAPAPPSRLTDFLLPRLAGPWVAEARRARFRALATALEEHVPAGFRHLPAGASPFVFPIAVADKDEALDGLTARGIEALDLWRVPHPLLEGERHPGAERLRRTLVGLPVHQELRGRDLARIVRAVREMRAAQPPV